jgi:16S rRNA (guanine966-N2)-methyltransferase
MRVVAGTHGGRVLRAPHGAATRPTSEKVREALFNILPDVTGPVLDLFAGSGALGIEALSRGASHATFVDAGKPALTALRTNLANLELAERATIVAGDAVAFAGRPAAAPWQLVFVDPPYASDLAVRAVAAIPPANLATDAVVVIEHDRRHVPPDAIGAVTRTDERRYGDTLISFYRGTKSSS